MREMRKIRSKRFVRVMRRDCAEAVGEVVSEKEKGKKRSPKKKKRVV